MSHRFGKAAPDLAEDSRSFLSQQGCQDLCQRIERATDGRGRTSIRIASTWRSDIKWARNRVMLLDDVQNQAITIDRSGSDELSNTSNVTTNQIDDSSLRSAVRFAESNQKRQADSDGRFAFAESEQVYPHTIIWSDRTYNQTAEARIAVVRELTDSAEQAGLLSAGDISVAAIGHANHVTDRKMLYAPMTKTHCSITVRDPDGTGSGWAGCSSYDWHRFDAKALVAIAIDKCLRSRNPVRLEPGRYTTILEPQATFDFVVSGIWGKWTRDVDSFTSASTVPSHPYHREPEVITTSDLPNSPLFLAARTKVGQKLVDQRFALRYSPDDPDLGVLPWNIRTGSRDPIRPATYFEGGVLAQLEYKSSAYRPGTNGGFAYRMDGGPTTIEEMIESTRRGLLVTRFDDVEMIDVSSLLFNGLTRDGLWLIENGKITKAVRNFRFTESPIMVLNNLEQLGTPVPVFSQYVPAVVPPIKVNDFSFTGMTDAV